MAWHSRFLYDQYWPGIRDHNHNHNQGLASEISSEIIGIGDWFYWIGLQINQCVFYRIASAFDFVLMCQIICDDEDKTQMI